MRLATAIRFCLPIVIESTLVPTSLIPSPSTTCTASDDNWRKTRLSTNHEEHPTVPK